MKICIEKDVTSREWNRLVKSDCKATFFHSTEWINIIENTIPGWAHLFITARIDGSLIGGIPLMYKNKMGILVVTSMPFGTYGGVLKDPEAPDETASKLTGKLSKFIKSIRVVKSEIVDVNYRIENPEKISFQRQMSNTQILDLSPGNKGLWAEFKSSNRNKIRKAFRSELLIKKVQSTADFIDYYRLFVDSCKRWNRPVPLGKDFFVALSSCDPDIVHLWMAKHGETPIAGLLNFCYHGTIMNWGNVSLSNSWVMAPNNLLHASAIKQAVRDNYKFYNFGANPNLPGVDKFKSGFGTQKYYYPCYKKDLRFYNIIKSGARFKNMLRKNISPKTATSPIIHE